MKHRWELIGCEPFSNIVGGLSQEQKHVVYENNYYELQKYKKLEKEFCITDNQDLRRRLENSDKLGELQEQIDCPIEAMVAVFKAIQQGFIFIDLGNGIYKENNISFDYEDISDDEEGYIGCIKSTNYHYILDYDGCIFAEDYKKTWWLKEDKSE